LILALVKVHGLINRKSKKYMVKYYVIGEVKIEQ
jgi:hypothetical protein